ncbi:MAG: hypothetical protein GYA21_02110 [Myxococcales bacterium]|nr:hypothetical protein [Myxococcales bacterium]
MPRAALLPRLGFILTALLPAGGRAEAPQPAEALRARIEAWKDRTTLQRFPVERVEILRDDAATPARARITLSAGTELGRMIAPLRLHLDLKLDPAGQLPPNGHAEASRLLEEGRRLLRRVEYSEVALRFLERFAPVRAELHLDALSPPRLRLFGTSTADGELNAHLEYAGPSAVLRSYRVPGIAEIPVRREILRFAEILTARHPKCRARWVWAQRLSEDGAPGGTTWQVTATLDGPSCPPDLTVVLKPDGSVEPDAS